MGPSSFLKIKLLGKGDVGRVYLVREIKSEKLFAMKGAIVSSKMLSPRNSDLNRFTQFYRKGR